MLCVKKYVWGPNHTLVNINVIIGELYCYVNRDGSRMIEFANNWRDAAFQIPDVRNLLSDTSAAAHRHTRTRESY